MKEMIRYGCILSLICVVASAALAGVNALTQPKITAQAKTEEEMSLKEVFTEGERFEAVKSGNDTLYYKVYNKEGSCIGAAFKASKKGYSSVVETIAGITNDGAITAIKVVNQNETPGLGSRVTEPAFRGQFSSKNIRSLNDIQAIAGATISSKTVMDSVKKKAEEIIELMKNEK
jgi:electron transport complex protein RnfG